MALDGKCTEEKIWKYLKKNGLNDYGVAGLMGNLFAESGLKPTNLQNCFERSIGMTDEEYTKAVDTGKYCGFIRDKAGYGLAQWTYWSRKKNLLEYATAHSKSIGDLEMQLKFLIEELGRNYAPVLRTLKSATSVRQASDVVLLNYERPADTGTDVRNKRTSYGERYYEKYARCNENVHIVRKGETLSGIAKKYGTSYKKLASINNIANHDLIYVGQKITIL